MLIGRGGGGLPRARISFPKEPRLRTVVEEDLFSTQLAALASSHRRTDEALAGLYFTLARIPEEFEQIQRTRISIVKTVSFASLPALRVFFTYTDDEVHLWGIEIAESDCQLF